MTQLPVVLLVSSQLISPSADSAEQQNHLIISKANGKMELIYGMF